MKKTIKFILKIKNEHNPPDLGSGKGIIATQEMDYNDEDLIIHNKVSFSNKLNEIMDNLIKEFITVEYEEI